MSRFHTNRPRHPSPPFPPGSKSGRGCKAGAAAAHRHREGGQQPPGGRGRGPEGPAEEQRNGGDEEVVHRRGQAPAFPKPNQTAPPPHVAQTEGGSIRAHQKLDQLGGNWTQEKFSRQN